MAAGDYNIPEDIVQALAKVVHPGTQPPADPWTLIQKLRRELPEAGRDCPEHLASFLWLSAVLQANAIPGLRDAETARLHEISREIAEKMHLHQGAVSQAALAWRRVLGKPVRCGFVTWLLDLGGPEQAARWRAQVDRAWTEAPCQWPVHAAPVDVVSLCHDPVTDAADLAKGKPGSMRTVLERALQVLAEGPPRETTARQRQVVVILTDRPVKLNVLHEARQRFGPRDVRFRPFCLTPGWQYSREAFQMDIFRGLEQGWDAPGPAG